MTTDAAFAKTRPALILLVLGNLLPLAGLIWWGWDAFVLLSLYWSETAILGVWMIVQLIAIALTDRGMTFIARLPAAVFFAAFFTVHAGGFMAGHMLFLWSVFAGKWRETIQSPEDFLQQIVLDEGLWLPLGILFIARGFEFFAALGSYIQGTSSEKVNSSPVIGRFYGRIIIMHVSILVGAGIAAKIGNIGPLIVLVVLKTAGELWQLRRSAPPSPVALSTVPAGAALSRGLFRGGKWNRRA